MASSSTGRLQTRKITRSDTIGSAFAMSARPVGTGILVIGTSQDPRIPTLLPSAEKCSMESRIRYAVTSQRLSSAYLNLGKAADIMFHEANNSVGQEHWYHPTSEMISSWISFRPEVLVLANSTCFLATPYRMASVEPAHFAQYPLPCISRGGYPSLHKSIATMTENQAVGGEML
jgi:hypothetical protein